MYDDLELALTDTLPAERVEIILDAYKTLQELGFEQQDIELSSILGLQDGMSDTDLLDGRVTACIYTALQEALGEFGITLNDSATLVHYTALLTTVAQFEFYIIPENLHDIVTGDGDSAEAVARLGTMFTALSETELVDVIETVSDATVARLRQVAEDNMHSELEGEKEVLSVEGYSQRISCLNRFLNDTDRQVPSLVLELSLNSVRCGTDLPALMGLIWEQIHDMGMEELAGELFGIVVFSDTPITEIRTIYAQRTKEFSDDRSEQHRLYTHAERVWKTYGAMVDPSGLHLPPFNEV